MLDFQPTLDKGAQILFLGGVSWICGEVLGFLGFMNCWLAFFTFWIVGSFLSMAFASQRLGSEGKAVMITGCDSGFGHSLALHLDQLGFRVFACCLMADKGGEGANTLEEKGSKKMHVIQMDVTSEEDVQSARETVEKLLPKDESLWGIVNNAGVSSFGYVEWIPLETYRKMAEVNVFGMINVIKRFLPLAKRSKGRVINVSSMMGRFGAPLRSSYVFSKYAVEGFSDCLRQEMKPYGVDVIVIEPGNFISGTSIFTAESVEELGEEMWESMSEETKSFYGEEGFKSQIETMKTYVTVGDTDIAPVMFAFEEALTQKYPQVRYQPADLYYKTRIFVSTHFPEWIYDSIYDGCPDK